MRCLVLLLLLTSIATSCLAQGNPDQGPTNEKAQKTYKEALDYLHSRNPEAALNDFKKADKQDGGRCIACQRNMIKYGVEYGDWKIAEYAAQEMVSNAQGDKAVALAHYELGSVFLQEGINKHKQEAFAGAHDEMTKALAAYSVFSAAVFVDGRALAYLKQNDAARARFQQYVQMTPADDAERQRALRFIEQPELAQGRLAPAFTITTSDGQRLSLDDLQGKAVLLDFWATWCAPCRAALPRIKSFAQKFAGQPFVVLSISLDQDERAWRDFIDKNGMSWPQYRDSGFTGPVAKLFDVTAIPHTFTIDADGILQDEHIGDAAIEGKLKKLVARAQELQSARKSQ